MSRCRHILGLLTLLVAFLPGVDLQAQTNMIVYLNDGSTIVIPVADIDSLTFTFGNFEDLPDVSTYPVEEVTTESASCGGEVLDEGTTPVTQKGICWSTSPNPNTGDEYTEEGPGGGFFISEMNGLIVNTGYYVRAYATNSYGTAYGATQFFATIDTTGFASSELGLVGAGLNYNGAQHNWDETIFITTPTFEDPFYIWNWEGVETNLSGEGFKIREGQNWDGTVIGSDQVVIMGSAADEIIGGGGFQEDEFLPQIDQAVYNLSLSIHITTGQLSLIVEPG